MEKTNGTTVIGTKFYRKINDVFHMYRQIRYKSSNESHTLIDLNTKEIIKETTQELKEKEYILLRPDGFITFNIVNISTKEKPIKDVIVCLHRKEDVSINTPYAICRQAIEDVFVENTLAAGSLPEDIRPLTLGCCISKDTCPANIDFNFILACDDVNEFKMSSIYLDDTLEDIQQYIFPGIHIHKFDLALKNLGFYFNQSKSNVRGLSNTVYGLLKSNSFMDDFDRAFDIHNIPFVFDNIENVQLTQEQYNYIASKILNCNPKELYVLLYDNDINLSDIQKKYTFIRTQDSKLFLIGYLE